MDSLGKYFFGGLGAFLIWHLWRFYRDYVESKRKSALFDREIQEKAIREHNAALSDDQLIDQANRGLGLNRGSKTDNKDPRG